MRVMELGRARNGQRVLVLVRDLDVRVLTEHGERLRQLTLDYQPQQTSRTMSRDITVVGAEGFEPPTPSL